MGTIVKKVYAAMNMIWVLLRVLPDDIGAELVAEIIKKLRELGDILIDWGENKIEATKTKVDDRLLLPALTQIREEFNIPDGDD